MNEPHTVMPSDEIKLREYLEAQIQFLESRVEAQQLANERALSIQAREYERRLDELNHAHATAVQTLATYIPREIADKRFDELLGKISALEQWQAKSIGFLTAAMLILQVLAWFIRNEVSP